jgi:hypothetical protein
VAVRDFSQRAGETQDARLNDWLDLLGTRQNIDLLNPLLTLADEDEFYVFDISTDRTYKVNAATLASYFSVAAGGGSVTSVDFTDTNDDTQTASGGPITISGTLDIAAVDAGSDKIVFWDDSAGKKVYLSIGTNLSITDTTLNATGGGGGITSVALSVVNDDTVSVSGSPITTTGTLTETAVDAGSDKFIFWDDSAGKKVYGTFGVALTVTDTTLNVRDQPYVASSMFNGPPTSSMCLLRHPLTQTVVFAAGLAPSSGIARVAATALYDCPIAKNGVSVGTMRWAAAGTVATFIMGSTTTFNANDILEVFAPVYTDATIADIGFSLHGLRIA